MPQLQLPMFPAGLTPINNDIAFHCEDGQVVYVHGHLPVFQHRSDDLESFRLFTSQLILTGAVRQVDIAEAFQVPLVTVKRYVKRFRERGSKGVLPEPRKRSESVLVGEVKQQAKELLEAGQSVPEVAREVNIKADTLRKAIQAGRLPAALKKNPDRDAGAAQQQE
ncbi:MAG: hypothetical protein ACRD2Y_11340 [Terriglobales bacterium]